MNKRELSQLIYIDTDIAHLKKRIEEIETRATHITQTVTDMPFNNGSYDKIADGAVELADVKALLSARIKNYFHEYNRIMGFIDSIEDRRTRLIFNLKYVNNLTWRQIALSLGGGNTEDGVRKIHDRYLFRYNKKLSDMSGLSVV